MTPPTSVPAAEGSSAPRNVSGRQGLISCNMVRAVGSRLARFVLWRRRPIIVGVTGSVGKTTTTEALGAVLTHPETRRLVGDTWRTANNLNNWVGLPLVILGYRDWRRTPWQRLVFLLTAPVRALWLATAGPYPGVLVLEYGTDRSGYLGPSVALAPPRIAVVTSIGPAHLRGLGSLAGVAQEKGTLVRGAPPDGLVVLGDGHDFVDDLERQSRAPVTRVTGRGLDLSKNVARVVCRHLGVPDAVIEEALRDLQPAKGRLNLLEAGGLTIIDDSYNANPLSMRLGLDTLAAITPAGGRRVAVLGTMGELGEASASYHRDIGAHARRCADLLVGVGEMGRSYDPDRFFPDSDACADAIGGLVTPGDCVLVKGSASVGMRKVVQRLTEPAASHR